MTPITFTLSDGNIRTVLDNSNYKPYSSSLANTLTTPESSILYEPYELDDDTPLKNKLKLKAGESVCVIDCTNWDTNEYTIGLSVDYKQNATISVDDKELCDIGTIRIPVNNDDDGIVEITGEYFTIWDQRHSDTLDMINKHFNKNYKYIFVG